MLKAFDLTTDAVRLAGNGHLVESAGILHLDHIAAPFAFKRFLHRFNAFRIGLLPGQDALGFILTTEALEEDLDVTGFIRAKLFVSSDAKDTDFTVKLVDVYPDGTAYNVDDTIFRARYRDGYDKQVFMNEGEVYELNPTAMSTSYEFKEGHRIRVEVASSKFPQYMRNLNTGGNNYDETEGVTAHNTVHHSADHPSQIVLPVRR